MIAVCSVFNVTVSLAYNVSFIYSKLVVCCAQMFLSQAYQTSIPNHPSSFSYCESIIHLSRKYNAVCFYSCTYQNEENRDSRIFSLFHQCHTQTNMTNDYNVCVGPGGSQICRRVCRRTCRIQTPCKVNLMLSSVR